MVKSYKKYLNNLCEVTWLDHMTFSHSTWRDEDELRSLLGGMVVKTYGKILFEDDVSIIMASTVGDNGSFVNEFCILKGCITGIKKLKIKDG